VTLYVVATPIGNLDDISFRAVEVIRLADYVVCEDTRISSRLLNRFGLSKKLLICRDDNESKISEKVLSILGIGESVCLICDAGTPCISDPGFRIVRACRKKGMPVAAVPGPCAVTGALSVSGLPTDGFLFVGFLPARTAARLNFFREYVGFKYTLVFYESCHRIAKFLDDAQEIFGYERTICVAKELTKFHEICHVGKLFEVRKKMKISSAKGEFVVIIAPAHFIL
jgi:16S rRNA (cytidine1402-2'-O)-methyltransferase